MQESGQTLLAAAGFRQYEVSGYARPKRECRHNMNYWQFGDYAGIGAGAHGKLTIDANTVERRWRVRHPAVYLRTAGTTAAVAGVRRLDGGDFGVEFMLNALRLKDGVPEYEARTGRSIDTLAQVLAAARSRGLLATARLQASALGWRFLNDLIAMFEPDAGVDR